MPLSRIRIATRESPLAMWQARHVQDLLQAHHAGLDVQLISMTTAGDRFLSAPLSQAGGKGMFIKELEHCLLDNSADIAVHSMKDVTVDFPDGLQLSVILPREDPRDALVSNDHASLAELPTGAVVGTSSMRRRTQLKRLRPDLEIRELRGNVGTRLGKLDNGDYDAIVLAAAGVRRLQLEHRIRELISVDDIIPAIGQGAIGIESRAGDANVLDLIRCLDDAGTHHLVAAERIISRRLYGGCQLPIAAHASETGTAARLRAMVGRLDGTGVIRVDARGALDALEQMAERAVDDLLRQGADRILKEVLDAG